jgi:hypothetical protein
LRQRSTRGHLRWTFWHHLGDNGRFQQTYSIRLDAALAAKVELASQLSGLTKSEVIRGFIEQGQTSLLLETAPAPLQLIGELDDVVLRLTRLFAPREG